MKWLNKGHELDRLGEYFKTHPKVYIYGAGNAGLELKRLLAPLNCFAGFLDGNPANKQENIVTLESLHDKQEDFIIVLASHSEAATAGMAKMCAKNGFIHNVFPLITFTKTLLGPFALYAHNKLIIEELPYVITERCTLRCKNCSQSVPYNKNPHVRSLEEVKNDLELFFKYVDFVERFVVSGGEAFTHPQFNEIIKHIMQTYSGRWANFLVLSNGTVTPNTDTLTLLQAVGAEIHLSDYRKNNPNLAGKYQEFVQTVGRYCTIVDAYQETWVDMKLGIINNKFSESEAVQYFDYCNTYCRYLHKGRLYYCLTEFCGQATGRVDADGESYYDLAADIPHDQKRKEIMEFCFGFVNSRGYLNACQQCCGIQYINKNKIEIAIQMQ